MSTLIRREQWKGVEERQIFMKYSMTEILPSHEIIFTATNKQQQPIASLEFMIEFQITFFTFELPLLTIQLIQ